MSAPTHEAPLANRYRGKSVVITGAASGIGLASAVAFARQGARVLLADIEAASLKQALETLNRETSAEVDAQVCDVSQRGSVLALAEHAFQRFGRVDVAFHNAGVGVSGRLTEMRHEDWQWVMGVNLWGAVHGVEAFAQRMVAQGGGGNILFNASFAGLVYSPTLGAYGASKAGVVALAEVLRQELREHGVGVSVLCPMRVATRIGSSGRNREARFGQTQAARELIDPRDESLPGDILDVEVVAQQVLAGIAANESHIMTHGAGRLFVQRRFDKIDQAFVRQHGAAAP